MGRDTHSVTSLSSSVLSTSLRPDNRCLVLQSWVNRFSWVTINVSLTVPKSSTVLSYEHPPTILFFRFPCCVRVKVPPRSLFVVSSTEVYTLYSHRQDPTVVDISHSMDLYSIQLSNELLDTYSVSRILWFYPKHPDETKVFPSLSLHPDDRRDVVVSESCSFIERSWCSERTLQTWSFAEVLIVLPYKHRRVLTWSERFRLLIRLNGLY